MSAWIPVSRSSTGTKNFLLQALLLLSLPVSGLAYDLAVESRVAKSGAAVELPIRFRTQTTPVAALVFEVAYDSTRLIFDAPAAKTRMGIPTSVNHAADLFTPAVVTGRIGISIYDPAAPVSTLSDGNVVMMRFLVRPEAEGFAEVRVVGSPAPDAADAAGNKVAEWNPADERTGIFIAARTARLSASPSSLSFGTILTGASADRDLFVLNSGQGGASIASIRVEPGDAFSLAFSPDFPLTIRENGGFRVPLHFQQTKPGRFNATLVIETSEPQRIDVPLQATVVDEGSPNHDVRFLIPAVATLPGAGGSRWRSSLAMVNASEQGLSAVMSLRSTTGSSTVREIHLAPGESRTLDDVLSELFDQSESSGALIIDSSSPDLILRSTTANETTEGAMLGQTVPVVGWEEVFRTGQQAWLAGLEQSETRQTSIALLNLAEIAIALKVVVSRDQEILGERTYVLEPGQIMQKIDVLSSLDAEGRNLSVRIEAISDDSLFFAYASTVDRRSGAPVFQSPR